MSEAVFERSVSPDGEMWRFVVSAVGHRWCKAEEGKVLRDEVGRNCNYTENALGYGEFDL